MTSASFDKMKACSLELLAMRSSASGKAGVDRFLAETLPLLEDDRRNDARGLASADPAFRRSGCVWREERLDIQFSS